MVTKPCYLKPSSQSLSLLSLATPTNQCNHIFDVWFKRSTCRHKSGKVISSWNGQLLKRSLTYPTKATSVLAVNGRLADCLNFLTVIVGPLNFKAVENSWSKNWTYPYFAVRSIERTLLFIIYNCTGFKQHSCVSTFMTEVLQQLNTFVSTTFWFERVVLRFVIEDAWISRYLRDVTS